MKEIVLLISAYFAKAHQDLDELNPPLEDAAIRDLAQRIQALASDLIDIGDRAYEMTLDTEVAANDLALTQAIHFTWMEECKQGMVLWRDTLFEYQKARVLLYDDSVDEEMLGKMHISSISILKNATAYQEKAFKNIETLGQDHKEALKYVDKWQQLLNPWSIYKEQFSDIINQCDTLIAQYGDLKSVAQEFERFGASTYEIGDQINQEINLLDTMATEAIVFVEENYSEPQKIVFQLETLEQQLKTPINLNAYKDGLDQHLRKHDKVIQVPIRIEGGMLQYKEIDFGRGIRQWLESEIHPSLYEMLDIVERVSNAMKMSLINIRNRAVILSKDTKEGKETMSNESIAQPLLTLQNNIKEWKKEVHTAHDILRTRLDESFGIAHIYDTQKEFLPIPLQSTLHQMRVDQNRFWIKAKNWFYKKTSAFHQLRSKVLKEESLSDAEKIIRYVKSRKYNHDSHHYDSIFTAEGYIGDSFCVGRSQELDHMVSLMRDWRDGYRGAVVLHGRRFSGKTLLGDLICHRYFNNDVIILRPSDVINVFGRRLIINHDLGEALEFIIKYDQNKEKLIWIDDLELWNDNTKSISTNIRKLMYHIDKGHKNLFFMVSMNSWSLNHYDRLFNFRKSIQSAIDLSQMSSDDVKNAILIRHGATHKTLMDAEGKEMNSYEFGRLTSHFYTAASGNIGESLRLWAYASEVTEDQQVVMNTLPTYELPDFVDENIAIVLRTILMHKHTNDYQLSKQFGPSYKTKYRVYIQRLLGLGILKRRDDGRLEIAEEVVNSVADLLEKHRHIQIELKK